MIETRKLYPYLISIGVFLVIFLLTAAYDKTEGQFNLDKFLEILSVLNVEKTMAEIGRSLALSAIVLICIVFLLGPLSKFFPKRFAKWIYLRREMGLLGFAMAAVHAIYSLSAFYDFRIDGLTARQLAGVFAGSCALIIFFLLSITSNKTSMIVLGPRWKILQRFGYVGLFIATIHFYLLETTPEFSFEFTPLSAVLFGIPILTIFVKLWSMYIERKEIEKAKNTRENKPPIKKENEDLV